MIVDIHITCILKSLELRNNAQHSASAEIVTQVLLCFWQNNKQACEEDSNPDKNGQDKYR